MENENSIERVKSLLLQAALPHVAFDGWSETTLRTAIADSAADPVLAQALFPRGGIDLAVAYHRAGDRAMAEALQNRDLSAMRFRDRVALAVRLRLELAEKEAVQRGTAVFALPAHAAEGAALIWGTADTIWNVLGDNSRDLNWYSKRTSLSAVYAATVLYWLGDQSEAQADTWEFLDRRIENVMQFEKLKAGLQENPAVKALLKGPMKVLERISAPKEPQDLPGKMKG